MIGKISGPGGHERLAITGKIVVVTAKKKKVGKVTPSLISGKGFIVTHIITDAGGGILQISFKEIKLRQKPKRIN